MWCDAQIGQARRNAPPDVMDRPIRHPRACVEPALVLSPRREATIGTHPEQLVATYYPPHALDNPERHRHQRQRMRAAVLTARGRERPRAALEVDLRPLHAADLGSARTEQNQQADDAAVVVVAAGAPDRGDLEVVKHALARLALARPGCADDGIAIDDSRRHRPREEAAQGGAR